MMLNKGAGIAYERIFNPSTSVQPQSTKPMTWLAVFLWFLVRLWNSQLWIFPKWNPQASIILSDFLITKWKYLQIIAKILPVVRRYEIWAKKRNWYHTGTSKYLHTNMFSWIVLFRLKTFSLMKFNTKYATFLERAQHQL